MKFNDYLREIHAKENIDILDDDMPDHFDQGLKAKTAGEILEYRRRYIEDFEK